MRTVIKIVCGIGAVATALSVHGVPNEKYQAIVERNVFRLKEPIQEIVVPTNNPPAGPKLFLTGITTILGNKLAMMQANFPGGPGQPARQEAIMLAEGQRDGQIEVRRIDEVHKTVEVDNSGTIMPLTFEKDGLKTTATPVPTNAASVPAAGAAASATPQPTTTSTNPLLPPVPYPAPRVGVGRTLRLPNATGPAPEQQVVAPAPPQSPAALGTHAEAARDHANGVATQLTPEQEQILRELEQGLKQAPQ